MLPYNLMASQHLRDTKLVRDHAFPQVLAICGSSFRLLKSDLSIPGIPHKDYYFPERNLERARMELRTLWVQAHALDHPSRICA